MDRSTKWESICCALDPLAPPDPWPVWHPPLTHEAWLAMHPVPGGAPGGDTVATPEPGTALLLGAVLMLSFVFRFDRRR